MTCLYKATIDDVIQAFMQTIDYHGWIEGGSSGKSLDKRV